MSASASPESPSKPTAIMMGFALAIAGLIGLALFSLSKLNSVPGASSLKEPQIQDTSRQGLPQFQHAELTRALTPEGGQGKWSLLTFWSVTCAPCLIEMPTMNRLATGWQGPPFQILTVNTDTGNSEDLENARRWLQEEQITLPTFFDKGHVLKKAFGVDAYPRHFLISPDREVVWQALGAFNWSEVATRDQLLKLMERRAPEPTEDPGE